MIVVLGAIVQCSTHMAEISELCLRQWYHIGKRIKLRLQKVSSSLATLCIELFLQHQQLRATAHSLAMQLPEAHKVHAVDVCWRAIPLQCFRCLW